MKQLMELLGLEIPKWEGPTVCDRSTPDSTTTDVKPPRGVTAKRKVKEEEEERKREAAAPTDDVSAEEETGLVKRERSDSSVEIKGEK